MAGSAWTAIEEDIFDDPRTIEMSTTLGISEYSVAGRLCRVWCRAYKHAKPIVESDDGFVRSYARKHIDDLVSMPGFAEAMESTGWLIVQEDGLLFPRFFTKNGEKRNNQRLDARRKAAGKNSGTEPEKIPDEDRRKFGITEEKRTEPVSGTGTGSDGASPPLEAGDEPDRKNTAKDTQTKTNGSQRSGSVFEHLTTETLRGETAFADWFRSQAESKAPVYANSEAGFRMACQACEQSLRKARDPVGMFVRLTTQDKPLKVVKDAQVAAEKRVQNAAKRKEESDAA